jgi:hypothetical protein
MLDGLTHKTPGRSGTYPEMRGKEDCGICGLNVTKSPENIAEDYKSD